MIPIWKVVIVDKGPCVIPVYLYTMHFNRALLDGHQLFPNGTDMKSCHIFLVWRHVPMESWQLVVKPYFVLLHCDAWIGSMISLFCLFVYSGWLTWLVCLFVRLIWFRKELILNTSIFNQFAPGICLVFPDTQAIRYGFIFGQKPEKISFVNESKSRHPNKRLFHFENLMAISFYYGRLSSAKLDRWQARSNGLHVDQRKVEKTVSCST